MAEPSLDRPSVVPPVRQRMAASMAKHVGMRLQFEAETSARAARSIMRAKPAVVNGVPRSLTKTKGDVTLSHTVAAAASSAHRQGAGARAWRPVLDPPHVQHGTAEVDLVPTQIGRPQPSGAFAGHGSYQGIGCRQRRSWTTVEDPQPTSRARALQLFVGLKLVRRTRFRQTRNGPGPKK
jgi:hypothetical protein